MIPQPAWAGWKVTPKLTLNLGLRYEFATPALEGKNQMANFDPTANAGEGGLVFAKSGGLQSRSLVQPNYKDFGPRSGASYSIDDKTVVRAGYGFYYSLFERFGSENQLALNPPFLINKTPAVAGNSRSPILITQNGFSLRAAYTYSHSLDNAPQELENNSGAPPDDRNYAGWYGRSDFDIPHRVSFNYIYELPFGRGKPFVQECVVGYILGGFKTSGVYTFYNGRPFTINGGSLSSALDPYGAAAATVHKSAVPAKEIQRCRH